jgi:hypothetical protein
MKGCGKTQLCHTMCVVAQVSASSSMEVLDANSHSSQKYDEFRPSFPVKKLTYSGYGWSRRKGCIHR